ncbi:ionic transporter y4hA [Taibaiella sp. KBW10]|uniref:calcium:proton antiporter n=1 Tax=Taibaiella sp. KBW10 TaxID=2153357 RepID=UPI000F59E9B7|nr:ionic transporter y4hA [Taibaiella sp. KBW10]RQO29859.1 ionic transporter y4hA [Taibaiella sp. KBW10]
MIKKYLNWSLLSPLIACLLYFSGLILTNTFFQIVAGIFLILSVLSAVHHSEVVAHKVGEPFGTIILAVAITIIEVAIIVSLMTTGGTDTAYLARDTVFAATMLILNGIIGFCLMIGGFMHREQFFSKHSTNTALVSLVAIILFTLVLPNYTTSIAGPVYSKPQLVFVAISCLVIYGVFLLTQTVRHRSYFLSKTEEEPHKIPSGGEAIVSLVCLIVCLSIVVLLAKKLSPTIEDMVEQAQLPKSLVGVIIATVVLLPEGIAAIKSARKNQLQNSLNLALGSALASIGLTIPAVTIVCHIYDLDLILGLDTKSTILLGLSVFIVMLSLSKGKTNMLYGVVLLVNLMAYIFTIIYP